MAGPPTAPTSLLTYGEQTLGLKAAQIDVLYGLGYTTPQELQEVNGNGLAQRTANQEASLKGWAEPFIDSATSAVTQDLLPILGQVAAAFGLGGEAAEGEAAGGGGAASAASKLGSSLSKIPKSLTSAALIAVLLDRNLWKGLAMIIAGTILLVIALRGAMR